MARRFKSHSERAKHAKRESRYIDFKREFNPAVRGEWVELVKDFAAFANSGGGAIVVGVENDGRPSREPIEPVLCLDPAKITDQLLRYTGDHFADFEINEVRRRRRSVAVIEVGAASRLLVFERPGTYPVDGGKQKTVFGRGTVYFRHGAKSEPANGADIDRFIERRLDKIRDQWLGDIRRVVAAPPGSEVGIFEPTDRDPSGQVTAVRFTDDPKAPVFGKLAPDQTHPLRQKELVAEVNKRLPGKRSINSHDILAVRRVHDITPDSAPQFVHAPKYGSWQYSEDFADWLASKKGNFFVSARSQYYELTHG